jgi:hypothetical protein
MTDPNADPNPKPSKTLMPAWLPYVGMAGMALAFVALFFGVGSDEVNSKFLFNNPAREVVATTGLAIFGFIGCMVAWYKRTVFTKQNPKSSEQVFSVLVVLFILTQMPFLKVQTKLEVLAGELTSMNTAMSAVIKIADDPANGISQETKKILTKEIFRETLIQSGDLQLHEQIK